MFEMSLWLAHERVDRFLRQIQEIAEAVGRQLRGFKVIRAECLENLERSSTIPASQVVRGQRGHRSKCFEKLTDLLVSIGPKAVGHDCMPVIPWSGHHLSGAHRTKVMYPFRRGDPLPWTNGYPLQTPQNTCNGGLGPSLRPLILLQVVFGANQLSESTWPCVANGSSQPLVIACLLV